MVCSSLCAGTFPFCCPFRVWAFFRCHFYLGPFCGPQRGQYFGFFNLPPHFLQPTPPFEVPLICFYSTIFVSTAILIRFSITFGPMLSIHLSHCMLVSGLPLHFSRNTRRHTARRRSRSRRFRSAMNELFGDSSIVFILRRIQRFC